MAQSSLQLISPASTPAQNLLRHRLTCLLVATCYTHYWSLQKYSEIAIFLLVYFRMERIGDVLYPHNQFNEFRIKSATIHGLILIGLRLPKCPSVFILGSCGRWRGNIQEWAMFIQSNAQTISFASIIRGWICSLRDLYRRFENS